MTNAAILEQIGNALYGGRWKSDLAGDLSLSARMLRLYASGSHPVPDAVVDRARDLARTRAETLLALAGDAAPVAASAAVGRPAGVPLDGDAYLALAKRLGSQRPSGMSAGEWAARNASTHHVRSRDTGSDLQLRGVGTFDLQIWGDVGRIEAINLRVEADRLALADYTLIEPA
ncbi:hypothetical protein [Aureimonas endophytica]|nr:hypothetical protein [Aureimonas endophytica]